MACINVCVRVRGYAYVRLRFLELRPRVCVCVLLDPMAGLLRL